MINTALTDRVALVTGASRGIGRAILEMLMAQGAKVVGTATTEKGAAAIQSVIDAANGEGLGLMMNVQDIDSIKAGVLAIQEVLGAPTILINNAGIVRDNLLLRMKTEEWDEVINTDLTSVFRVTQACLKGMLKARWGRIISIGSVVGSTGNPGAANYSAAKAGLCGFSKSLAAEVASRNITVNVVAPGFIDTDMTQALTDEQKEAIFSRIPLGRMGKPEEIAAMVAFLASEAGDYITGQEMHVNGGMLMA